MTEHPALLLAEKLMKPCPFCGGPGELRQEDDNKLLVAGMWEAACKNDKCPAFSLHIRTQRYSGAVAMWNRRVGNDDDDTRRLNYMIESSAYVAHSRDGDDCWLMIENDDGEHEHQGRMFNSARDAIDAQRACRERREG